MAALARLVAFVDATRAVLAVELALFAVESAVEAFEAAVVAKS
jgi:hypothetical protein